MSKTFPAENIMPSSQTSEGGIMLPLDGACIECADLRRQLVEKERDLTNVSKDLDSAQGQIRSIRREITEKDAENGIGVGRCDSGSERRERMNFQEARIMALMAQVYASQARVEGMKAANAAREHRGEAQAYPENSFSKEADLMDMTASEIQSMSQYL